jgi:hypothetical protein
MTDSRYPLTLICPEGHILIEKVITSNGLYLNGGPVESNYVEFIITSGSLDVANNWWQARIGNLYYYKKAIPQVPLPGYPSPNLNNSGHTFLIPLREVQIGPWVFYGLDIVEFDREASSIKLVYESYQVVGEEPFPPLKLGKKEEKKVSKPIECKSKDQDMLYIKTQDYGDMFEYLKKHKKTFRLGGVDLPRPFKKVLLYSKLEDDLLSLVCCILLKNLRVCEYYLEPNFNSIRNFETKSYEYFGYVDISKERIEIDTYMWGLAIKLGDFRISDNCYYAFDEKSKLKPAIIETKEDFKITMIDYLTVMTQLVNSYYDKSNYSKYMKVGNSKKGIIFYDMEPREIKSSVSSESDIKITDSKGNEIQLGVS